ncbi:MAG TPA: hypothetical protein VLN49_23830 [Gemmatimonadaceae bacterium]|nr:hypothetical protein [Gemmatimonadaceae bacterium]
MASNHGTLRIGFTGSRHGLSQRQRAEVERLLRETAPAELHHGGCVGADAEAHDLALALGVPSIVVHRSVVLGLTADIQQDSERSVVTLLEPRKPLKRNRDIARAVDLLIAAPATIEEIERSGTWSTVRFARRCLPNVRVIVVPPSGF